jgi:hypothetical protein
MRSMQSRDELSHDPKRYDRNKRGVSIKASNKYRAYDLLSAGIRLSNDERPTISRDSAATLGQRFGGVILPSALES